MQLIRNRIVTRIELIGALVAYIDCDNGSFFFKKLKNIFCPFFQSVERREMNVRKITLILIFFADNKFLACKSGTDSYFSPTPKDIVVNFYLMGLNVI